MSSLPKVSQPGGSGVPSQSGGSPPSGRLKGPAPLPRRTAADGPSAVISVAPPAPSAPLLSSPSPFNEDREALLDTDAGASSGQPDSRFVLLSTPVRSGGLAPARSNMSFILRSPCALLCIIGFFFAVSLIIIKSAEYRVELFGSHHSNKQDGYSVLSAPHSLRLLARRRFPDQLIGDSSTPFNGSFQGEGDLVEIFVDSESVRRLHEQLRLLESKRGVEHERLRGSGVTNSTLLTAPLERMVLNEVKLVDDDTSNNSSALSHSFKSVVSPAFAAGLSTANSVFGRLHPRLKEDLEFKYIAYEKDIPYVGDPSLYGLFDGGSGVGTDSKAEDWVDKTKLLNSIAVFPSYESLGLPKPKDLTSAFHGALGYDSYGYRVLQPKPMPPLAGDPRVNMTKELADGGGFYAKLSAALPLDRDVKEARDAFCLNEKFDLNELEDASIIITFYNEHLPTLLRSVHSVLNRTPAPLLREIILVDDHSNLTQLMPGSDIYRIVRTLPKTKLVRMPERRGIVMARLAGAKLATAPVLVILDSHIEVNNGWLEPQLKRLRESPRSIVMPQIDVLDSTHFNWTRDAGIGCWLGFKWVMQEQASLTVPLKNDHPIPSPSMGGGLFAVRADWFWEIGGYDEGFEMWGAENVEMGFRVWMCGGRLECTPCARVYHIYRQGGVGYASPPLALAKNRLRTSRVWMDEYSVLAELFIAPAKEASMGNIDRMLELKERLKCKPFQWYLSKVDPTNEIQSFKDIVTAGEIRNVQHYNNCIDTLAKSDVGWTWGTYGCHGQGGTQGFLFTRSGRMILFLHDRRCLNGGNQKIDECETILKDHGMFQVKRVGSSNTNAVANKDTDDSAEEGGEFQVMWKPVKEGAAILCMGLQKESTGGLKVIFETCEETKREQHWKLPDFKSKIKNYEKPKLSAGYLERKRIGDSIYNKSQNLTVWKYGEKPDKTIEDQLILADV